MIKTKPHQKPISTTEAMTKPPQRVGGTYGDRRAQHIQPAIVSRKSVDSFNRPAGRPADLSSFAPDTAYKARRAYAKGIPYKNFIHHKIETGELIRADVKEVKRPSDNAILKFLDRVIEVHAQPVRRVVKS